MLLQKCVFVNTLKLQSRNNFHIKTNCIYLSNVCSTVTLKINNLDHYKTSKLIENKEIWKTEITKENNINLFEIWTFDLARNIMLSMN